MQIPSNWLKRLQTYRINSRLSVFDIEEDAAVAENYNVELTPGLVIAGEDDDGPVDYGIRHAGIPSGHEFSSLIQDILLVSSRDSGLGAVTREFLAGLTEPVLLAGLCHAHLSVLPSSGDHCP